MSATTTKADEGIGHATDAARGQPLERRVAGAKLESCRPVLRVEACHAPVDEQTAERHDEGLQLHLGDEEAVEQADDDAGQHDQTGGRAPRQAVVGHQADEDDAEQREDRADREIDAARDDDEAFADREQAVEPDQVRGVRDVDGRDEAGVQHRHDGAHHHDEEEKPEVLLQHGCSVPNEQPGRRRGA